MQEAMARFKGGIGNFTQLIDDLMSAVQKVRGQRVRGSFRVVKRCSMEHFKPFMLWC
jgi:hypothetical protein